MISLSENANPLLKAHAAPAREFSGRLPTAKTSAVSIVDPAQDADWDRRIAHAANVSIFHSAAWCRVLRESYGYKPFYLVRRDGVDFSAVLPIMEMESRLLGRRAVSLPFTDQCSVLSCDDSRETFLNEYSKSNAVSTASATSNSPEWRALMDLAGSRGWKSFECRDGAATLPASQVYYEHVLDLAAGEKELWQRCDSSTRRAVQKGERSGLEIRQETSLEATRNYYRLHCLTRKHHGLPPQPFCFFENIQRHVLNRGLGFILSAWKGERPVSAAVFFHFGKNALYKFGASDRQFLEVRGNNLIMWEAIKHFSAAGFQRLSFGKTDLQNSGLRRFKSGWGAREGRIVYSRFNFQKKSFSKEQPGREHGWHNRLFKIMPVPIARWMGAALYRYAG